MTKTKNVQDFSPASTRIYLAAKRGITLRTNPSHVKRIIDKELDKHSLSTEKIKKEISDATGKAVEIEIKKVKKLFNDRIEELKEQIVDLEKDFEGGVKKLVKAETKELQEKIGILESEKKSLIDEAKYLVEDKEALIAQFTDLQNKKSDKKTEKEDTPSNGPIEDTPPDPEKGPDQEEKPAEGKKK